GNAVEDCRLAGTIRTDDRGDIAATGAEGDIVDGNEAAEPHGQMLDFEKRRRLPAHQPWPSLTRSPDMARRDERNSVGWRWAMRPRGRQIMITTMARPKSNIRYCVGSKSAPKICFNQSSSRRSSVPPIIAIAAMA